MTDMFVRAYLPLLVWPSVGLIVFRFLPDTFPRFLGRLLYWVGVPVEIAVLARQADFAEPLGWVPVFTVGAILVGLFLAYLSLRAMQIYHSADIWGDRPRQGSFILASMISNTGFVGLAIAPMLIDSHYLSWVVLYSVIHNIAGTYGIGVYTASYFGNSGSTDLPEPLDNRPPGWQQLRDVVTVPSLWAFGIGYLSRPIDFNPTVEMALHQSVWVIIPTALLLMGMRLSQLQGWKSLRLALVPMAIKIFILPILVGIVAVLIGLPASPRLALVLMSGMPTAFAGLILAEEYDLDRELISSSIVLTTAMLLLTIPIWLILFGDQNILFTPNRLSIMI